MLIKTCPEEDSDPQQGAEEPTANCLESGGKASDPSLAFSRKQEERCFTVLKQLVDGTICKGGCSKQSEQCTQKQRVL